jgi:hypothetical protein
MAKKMGGARPGAGRKPKQLPLRERAEEARAAMIKRDKRESQARLLALKKEAQAHVARVLDVTGTEWAASDSEWAVESVIEGLRFQYDTTPHQEGLYVYANIEEDDEEGWHRIEDLEDLGYILSQASVPIDDPAARAAAALVQVPDGGAEGE